MPNACEAEVSKVGLHDTLEERIDIRVQRQSAGSCGLIMHMAICGMVAFSGGPA